MAIGAAEGVVVTAVGASAVNKHAVQLVQVAFGGVRGGGQVPPPSPVQVQQLRELVPVVYLHPPTATRPTLASFGGTNQLRRDVKSDRLKLHFHNFQYTPHSTRTPRGN